MYKVGWRSVLVMVSFLQAIRWSFLSWRGGRRGQYFWVQIGFIWLFLGDFQERIECVSASDRGPPGNIGFVRQKTF
jgi:hypothetical protein